MSGKDARRMRRRREREQRKAVERGAIRAVRAQGCTCNPEVAFDAPDHPLAAAARDGVVPATVKHDSWCPLLRVIEERPPSAGRTQIAITLVGEEPER